VIAAFLAVAMYGPVLPVIASAVSFAPGSVGAFVAAYLGGLSGGALTTRRAIEAHERRQHAAH